MADDFRETIHNLLQHLPTGRLDALKRLFWSELNYNRAGRPLSTRDWPPGAVEAVSGAPQLFATAGQDDGFHVIYTQLSGDRLSLGAERAVITRLLRDHPYGLFVFSDASQTHWHFVNVRYEKSQAPATSPARRVLRRITAGPHERLRTAAERVSMLDIASLSPDLFGLSPLAIQQRHDEAFNVEAVTGQFFKGYNAVFGDLQAEMEQQTGDRRWAHDYALQFLNRLMFLYYVQRKRWLGDDPDFIAGFWTAYRRAARPADTFVAEWLHVLFFEAFNDRYNPGHPDHQHLPESVRDALALAPYLNGGLFEPNTLDRKHTATISDARFRQVFDFLERYNFTIAEDTPLDQEVAVDPEMIGKVYESLVNVSDETDERGEAGIFYTPRVEIDLMCRLALVDYLNNHLSDSGARRLKSLLYEAVFAFDEADKAAADTALAEHNLWPNLNDLLRQVTVVDPACGSGSFLVGMLYVLDDLLTRANSQRGEEESPYERKKRIIGRSLYGVDVMEWAAHVAELRLWLQLAIDTDLEPAELRFRPLLPNLSFKLRPGDSLVQAIGGINLAVRHGNRAIPPALKGELTRLQGEKLKYFNNAPDRKYRTAEALQEAELQVFRAILDARAQDVVRRLKEVEAALKPQANLFGEIQDGQMSLERPKYERQRDELLAEQEQLSRARQALRTARDIPFVWDIAFVEIFAGDRDGFDIVIGNPPYVRQELIRDPRLPADAVTPESKRTYKDKLARSVYTAWPRTFGFDWAGGKPRWKLDAKSDLYIYFYFHGLSLLNDRGAFCFITSNSWLDVGYGKDLQEFLLTGGRVRLIIDNQLRRSFASAEVNTVIALLGAAHDTRSAQPDSADHVARFVMLAVPFEQTLSPVVWEEIEETSRRHSCPEYHIFPVRQGDLLA